VSGKSPSPARDDLASVERAVHATIRALGPELRRQKKWQADWYAGTDLICAAARFRQHVGVEFWRGSELVAAGVPLEGIGKNLRHLKVRTLAEATEGTLPRAIREALRLDATGSPRPR
jgi:hypothetical protein